MIFNNLMLLSKSLLLTAFIFALSTQSNANTKNNLLDTGFTASYDVSKNDFHLGVSERQLVKERPDQYTYKAFTYATGVASWFVKDKVTEVSHFK